ncbi:MAG: AAA family ATPase, partial [bacterium]
MIIKRVEVKNFRSIQNAKLDCDKLTDIIGRNGVGKSSFLHAINTYYDIAASISDEDFFDRDTNVPIEIRVTYGFLRDDEKVEFKTYVRNDELIVTKRIVFQKGQYDQRYYAAAMQVPQFAEIRAISGKRECIKAWNELVERNELPNLTSKARSADEVEQFMKEYEGSNPEFTEPIEREEQFFGPRNIGGGKLDKFTKFVLIPAVREAYDEVTAKRGAIYQLLDMIVLRKVSARKDIQEFRLGFEEEVKKLYSSDNLTELPELGVSISETLEKFAPGSKLNLKWDDPIPPKIQLPSPRATLVEDNFEGEINRKGHGLQRALILTLLQHLAMTAPISPVEDGSNEEEITNLQPEPSELLEGPDLILAIEEPELYLHPSRCRYLGELLLKLAENPDIGLGSRNQIIYTTHSPYFVDLDRFDQIRMIRKTPQQNLPVPSSVVTRFSLEQAKNELAKVCNVEPKAFTSKSFKARTMPVMNTIVNEGFFAEVVVVVEGLSEVATLWKLQEIMKKDWFRLGVVVVPAGGKNNIDRPTIIFRGFSIPTYFIFDADSQLIGKKHEGEAKKRNYRYLRLAGVPTEDFPSTQVNETWAVFHKNLEGVFKETLGDD